MIVLLLLCLVLCGAARAQLFEIGVKAGVPLTDNFSVGNSGGHASEGFYSSKTRHYTFGPTVTVHFPHRLGLEMDALYRRLNYDSYSQTVVSAGDGGTVYQWRAAAGNRLELPILVRWSPTSRAYIAAGPTVAIHSGFNQRIHTIQNLVIAGNADTLETLSRPAEMDSRVASGVTFGLGCDTASKRFHLKPELRYSLWISQAFPDISYFSAPRHELVFLLGFEFGGQ